MSESTKNLPDNRDLFQLVTQETRQAILEVINGDSSDDVELKTIEDKVNKHRTTIYDHLEKLTDNGLIERLECPELQSRSKIRYALTDKGKMVIERIDVFDTQNDDD